MIPFAVSFGFRVMDALRARDLALLDAYMTPKIRKDLERILAAPEHPLHRAILAYKQSVQARREGDHAMVRFGELADDRLAVILLDLPPTGVQLLGLATVSRDEFDRFGRIE